MRNVFHAPVSHVLLPLQKGPVRLEPVGLDRHYNRYWLLPASAAASDPAHPPPPEAPPLLVIERHSLDSILPASVEAAAAAVAGPAGSAGAGSGGSAAVAAAGGGSDGVAPAAEPAWQVGLYNSILHLQQLAQWLNPKGSRERPLAEAVTRLLDQHQQWAMQHVQPPRAPMEEEGLNPDPAAARAAAVGALQAALLSFEEGNQPATYDELTGSEERRAHWRAMVGAASTPQVGRVGCDVGARATAGMPLCNCQPRLWFLCLQHQLLLGLAGVRPAGPPAQWCCRC